MAFGLDIYRYQTVTSYAALKQAGVTFCLVKVTDGFGPAIVKGDAQVKGLQSVGIPVGGYHFAQKGRPVDQARAFKKELDRLDAWGVLPALDIENNTGITWGGNEAHDFAMAFCREMLEWGPRCLLYANTSELRAMRAHQIVAALPGVYIWEANYGSNNGAQHKLPDNPWGSRRAIHQYTSRGRVHGIKEHVDCNEGNLGIILLNSKGDNEVSWDEPSGVKSDNDPDYEYSMKELVVGSNVKDNQNHQILHGIAQDVADLRTRGPAVTLTPEQMIDVKTHLAGLIPTAADIADEIDRRNRDGNPNTGATS